MAKSFAWVCMSGMVLAACNGEDGRARANRATSATDAASQEKLVLRPSGLVRGATNVDVAAGFNFSAPVKAINDPSLLDVVRSRARILDSEAAVMAVEAEVLTGKDPSYGLPVAIRPATPLQHDRWYWLVIEEDATLQVEDPLQESGSTWQLHFFTGSAPRVVQVEYRLPPKSPNPVFLRFSEPVDVASIQSPSLLSMGGKSISKCILQGSACLSGQVGPLPSETAQVDIGAATLDGELVVALNATAQGSGRSVADGAKASGDAVVQSSGGNPSLAVAIGQWQPCQEGASRCWVERRSLPTP